MIRENPMTLGLFAAIAGLALVPTPVLAGTQDIGTITMFLCDGGQDLCSNTLYIPNTTESQGQFTDNFTFNFVNTFPGQNNVPLLTVIVNYVGLPPSVSLHDPSGQPFGLSSVVDGSTTIQDLIDPGNGYYVEVTGAPPVSFSGQVSAFDLGGPVGTPEPSTWAMLCLGFAGLALIGSVRTAMGKKHAA